MIERKEGNTMGKERLWKLKEVAKKLGIHEDTIRKRIKRGSVTPLRPMGAYRFRYSDIVKMIGAEAAKEYFTEESPDAGGADRKEKKT